MRLPYLIFLRVVGLLVSRCRSSASKDVELVLLRHEVTGRSPRKRSCAGTGAWSPRTAGTGQAGGRVGSPAGSPKNERDHRFHTPSAAGRPGGHGRLVPRGAATPGRGV